MSMIKEALEMSLSNNNANLQRADEIMLQARKHEDFGTTLLKISMDQTVRTKIQHFFNHLERL